MDQKVLLLASVASLLLIKKRRNKQKNRKTKRYWIHPTLLRRKELGHYDNLMMELRVADPYRFYNFTRLSPALFDKLLSIVGPSITKNSPREPISAGCRLAVTLRFLATGDSYPSLSYAFRLGVSTICNIIQETCLVLWQELQPIVLQTPDENKLLRCSVEFYNKWSLPHCAGAIDGKHVVIRAPNNSGSSYFNYKKNFSIVLLAMCDANYCFTYVDIGAYGSQSDGGILNKSSFGKKIIANEIPLPAPSQLPNADDLTKVPYFFVGDEAFPLRINLMRPYAKVRTGRMALDELIFNYRLSRARRVIENVFGILVARFQIYHRVINAKPETVDSIIGATVCLHNFIRKENYDLYFTSQVVDSDKDGAITHGSWRNEIPNEGSAFSQIPFRLGARNATLEANIVRNNLKTYLNGIGAALAPWQWDVVNKTN